jgi:hypothetical protein
MENTAAARELALVNVAMQFSNVLAIYRRVVVAPVAALPE